MLKRLLGILLLILAFFWIGSEFTGTDWLTKIVLKAVGGGLSIVGGLRLLSSGTGVKWGWVPAWVAGWILASAAVVQVPYSAYQIQQDSDVGARLTSAFWALVAPFQFRWGIRAIHRARKASAPSAEAVLAKDPRERILYLRRFELDRKGSAVRPGREFGSLMFNTKTDEELIAEVLDDIGPCVAIGKPIEQLPPLGFAREYAGDEWQERVLQSMAKARLVVVMFASASAKPENVNFVWEVRKAVELVNPQRLLFFVPGEANDLAEYRRITQMLLPQTPPDIPKGAIFQARMFRAVLYFGSDWRPQYAVPKSPGHFRRPLVPNKLTAILRNALRPVYEQIGLEWRGPRVSWSRVVYEGISGFVLLSALGMVFGR